MPTLTEVAPLASAHGETLKPEVISTAAEVRRMGPADMPEVRRLHDVVFGPGAYARTAYRLREASAGLSGVSMVSRLDGELVAAISFTDILIGGAGRALLLGPLVVATAHAGRGFGKELVARGLDAARESGVLVVLLVGNESYYARFGFQRVPIGQIRLPGPVDYARLLAAELEPGALVGFRGMVDALR